MFFGIFLGYLLRKTTLAQIPCRLVMPCIFALLFCMGVLIGNNKEIMNNLGSLGIEGLLIAVASLVGSCLVVTIISRIFLKGYSPDQGHAEEQAAGQPAKADEAGCAKQ